MAAIAFISKLSLIKCFYVSLTFEVFCFKIFGYLGYCTDLHCILIVLNVQFGPTVALVDKGKWQSMQNSSPPATVSQHLNYWNKSTCQPAICCSTAGQCLSQKMLTADKRLIVSQQIEWWRSADSWLAGFFYSSLLEWSTFNNEYDFLYWLSPLYEGLYGGICMHFSWFGFSPFSAGITLSWNDCFNDCYFYRFFF